MAEDREEACSGMISCHSRPLPKNVRRTIYLIIMLRCAPLPEHVRQIVLLRWRDLRVDRFLNICNRIVTKSFSEMESACRIWQI